MKLAVGEFEIMAKFIKEISGISLEKNKTYLIESRLSELAEKETCKTFSDLFFKAKFNKLLQGKIIDAISTNETSFFRDTSPFEALRYKIIPDIVDKKMALIPKGGIPKIRIWSAACSTGQEACSIAMTFIDMLPDIHTKWSVSIVATDIADEMIMKASRGFFSDFEVNRGLPPGLRDKYFINKQSYWQVNDKVRSLISFKRLNLLESFVALGKFDIIFCRNVAIYFDLNTKKILFNKMADILNDNGYLFIGASETLIGITEKFVSKTYHKAIVYQVKK